jgi:phosphatidylglycerophosphatase A
VNPPAGPSVSSLRRSTPLDALATAVATGLGSGYSPVAPGTAGSLVGLALFWGVHHLSLPGQAAATAAMFALGVAAAGHVARRMGVEDPGRVVADEVAGMWVSLLGLPLTGVTAAAAFVLFRIFDVFKPYPARDLERLPGGWGIMCDDVMAGIYANLLLRAGLLAWPVSS